MKKSYLLGAVCACLTTASLSVNAATIIDNGTYTTVDGVDWLDLTETAGMSYNDVIAQMASGGALEGWAYATTTQVEGLWTAFGGNSNYYDGWSTQNNGLFDVMAPYVGDLICHDQQSSCVAGDGYSWWITATLEVMVTSDAYTNPEAALKDAFQTLQGPGSVLPPDIGDDYLGSALVRPTSVVPVPAAVWLFGSGLLGLVGVARRKKA